VSLLGSRLFLVGPGRAGSSLARSWTAAGGALAGVAARTASSAEAAARRLGAEDSCATEGHARIEADVIAVSVPDDRIAEVAREIAPRAAARFAFHLSGAFPADELAPLRRAGAALGALHPLGVFTGAPGESWTGAFVAVEGDPEAVAEAERIVRALGGRPHRLDRAAKPLYHAAAAIAAGGTAALVSVAVSLWGQAGLQESEARPALARLSRGAAEAAETQPLDQALTGPVARRDLRTVASHAAALREIPAAAAIYSLLAEVILRETAGRGNEEKIREALPRDLRDREP